jgi:hypothetical protein
MLYFVLVILIYVGCVLYVFFYLHIVSEHLHELRVRLHYSVGGMLPSCLP